MEKFFLAGTGNPTPPDSAEAVSVQFDTGASTLKVRTFAGVVHELAAAGATLSSLEITEGQIDTLVSTDITADSLVVPAVDLGESGVAGSLDIFPTTAAKGRLSIAAADNAGDTVTAITNASQAGARTYTIPDALASCDFLLGKQGAVAVTATDDGLTTGIVPDGGRLQHVTVTSGNSAHLVTLPTPTPGTIVVLHVGSNGFKLQSSAPASVAINGGTGASASSTIAAESTCFMVCVSATSWKGFFLDADSDLAKVAAAS